MIYIKINSNKYNELNIDNAIKDYPLLHLKAIYRIVKNIINKDLKLYPEIDIVINFKYTKIILGRFYRNRIYKGVEYNFIGNKGNPCIVLFWRCIDDFYLKHNIKGLKKVLYHEYGHFKQWLLTNKCGHNKNIEGTAKINELDNQLILCKQYLNDLKQ